MSPIIKFSKNKQVLLDASKYVVILLLINMIYFRVWFLRTYEKYIFIVITLNRSTIHFGDFSSIENQSS